MSRVELRKINYSIGNRIILKDVSFKVDEGELYSILGPSGVGKTTIFKIITGALEAKTGDILLDGERINEVPIEKRNIVMVHQGKQLFPHMTIRENVEFGLKMRKISKDKIKEKVDSLVEFFNMSDHMKKYPYQLSGGQQQLIALMRALAVEPKVLLLDEPFTGLDSNLRNYVRDYIMKVQRKFNITTIMITHDKEDAFSMSNAIGFIFDGRIVLNACVKNLSKPTKIECVDNYLGDITTLPDGRIIFSDRIIDI